MKWFVKAHPSFIPSLWLLVDIFLSLTSYFLRNFLVLGSMQTCLGPVLSTRTVVHIVVYWGKHTIQMMTHKLHSFIYDNRYRISIKVVFFKYMDPVWEVREDSLKKMMLKNWSRGWARRKDVRRSVKVRRCLESQVRVSGRKKEPARGKAKRCPQCLVLQDEDVKSR